MNEDGTIGPVADSACTVACSSPFFPTSTRSLLGIGIAFDDCPK